MEGIPVNSQYCQENELFIDAKWQLLEMARTDAMELPKESENRKRLRKLLQRATAFHVLGTLYKNPETEEIELVPQIEGYVRISRRSIATFIGINLDPEYVDDLPPQLRVAFINGIFSTTKSDLEKSLRFFEDVGASSSAIRAREEIRTLESAYRQLTPQFHHPEERA